MGNYLLKVLEEEDELVNKTEYYQIYDWNLNRKEKNLKTYAEIFKDKSQTPSSP